MGPRKACIIFFCISILTICESYRILAVFPFNGASHNIVFEALIKGLLKSNHRVDHITHYPIETPSTNYRNIINLHGSFEAILNNYTIELVSQFTNNIVHRIAVKNGNRLCHLMGSEEFQKLVKNPPKDPPYDLVITEAFAAHCYFGLGYVFDVPVVAISSSIEFPWISHFVGNHDNLAVVPNIFQVGAEPMSFWQRLENVLNNYITVREFHSLTEESQTQSMRKYLRPDIPSVRQVEKNVALVLVNGLPAVFSVKPTTPAMIQVSGLHLEENVDKLPPELQEWMDQSIDGVVYFSFGSMVLIETLPKEQLVDIYASFQRIAPVRVLMRIANQSRLLPGIPQNIKVLPWVPQKSVLAHPNTKVFITHGGLLGLLEALHSGVPMIGVPLFSDQFRNVDAFVAKGVMLRIDFKEFSKKTLDLSLHALLHDPQFKAKAAYYSRLVQDQPLTPMKTAIFWIEYVVRNGGKVLRSPALDMTWWQLTLLDVFGVILMSLVFALAAVFCSISFTLRQFSQSFSNKTCRNVDAVALKIKKSL